MKNRNKLMILALCGTAALALSACGKAEDTNTAVPTEETEEIEIEEATGEVTEEATSEEGSEEAVSEESAEEAGEAEDAGDATAEDAVKDNGSDDSNSKGKQSGSSSLFAGGAGGASITGGASAQDSGYDLDDFDFNANDFDANDFGDNNTGNNNIGNNEIGDILEESGLNYEITDYENTDSYAKIEGHASYDLGEDIGPVGDGFSFSAEYNAETGEGEITFKLDEDDYDFYDFKKGPKSKAGLNNSMELNNGKSVDSRELGLALDNIRNLFGNTTPDDNSVSDNSPKENDKDQNGTKLK